MGNKLSRTIQEFREVAVKNKGPQISSMYEVILYHFEQDPLYCYPLSVVVPGRQFVFYDQDLWGPTRKIPYKRGYTQCHMSFVVYQNWEERQYIENWMNSIVNNYSAPGTSVTGVNSGLGTNISLGSALETARAIGNAFSSGGSISQDADFGGGFQDFVDYATGVGLVEIRFLNSSTKAVNSSVSLIESYPAAMSQMGIGADGTGYSTFNVTFQFNEYIYRNYNAGEIRSTQIDNFIDPPPEPQYNA